MVGAAGWALFADGRALGGFRVFGFVLGYF